MHNYKIIRRRLQELEPFNGNSLRGYWDSETMEYLVISYRTLVASRKSNDSIPWVTDIYYSPTTSRHLAIVKEAWNVQGQLPKRPSVPKSKSAPRTKAGFTVVKEKGAKDSAKIEPSGRIPAISMDMGDPAFFVPC